MNCYTCFYKIYYDSAAKKSLFSICATFRRELICWADGGIDSFLQQSLI